MPLLTLKDLTPQERLFIWRNRKGLSFRKAGWAFRVTRKRFILWEYDGQGNIPSVPLVDELEPHECCVILRRRAELLQSDIAKELGVSRLWVNRMEKGKEDPAKLVDYWEGAAV